MKASRHALTLATALLLAAAAPKLYAQTTRIAVVDLQRALNETEDGRRAKARLKRLFKQRQQSLDKRQTELKVLKEQIEKQIKIWNEDTKQRRLQDYQEKMVELQQTYMEYQRELAQQEAALTGSIIERMQRILRRMGQAEGYTLIVERNEGGVVWVPAHLDLTDQVIQRYNQGEGRESGGGQSRGRTKSKKGG